MHDRIVADFMAGLKLSHIHATKQMRPLLIAVMCKAGKLNAKAISLRGII